MTHSDIGSYVNLKQHVMSDGYCEAMKKTKSVKLPYITLLLSLHNFISQGFYYSAFICVC